MLCDSRAQAYAVGDLPVNLPAGTSPGRAPARAAFRNFLDTSDEAVAPAHDIHPVLHHYATHKTPLIRRWLSIRRAFI